jgi:AAA15 family ATPase/GTPase
MIREVKIQNYKSIESLDLELGRINVLIGENGCGKTNILEAIALASAAYSDKLDNEFLVSRGIRVTAPQLMRSAFDKENTHQKIILKIIFNDYIYSQWILENKNSIYSKWEIDDQVLGIKKHKNKDISNTEIQDTQTKADDLELETMEIRIDEESSKTLRILDNILKKEIDNIIKVLFVQLEEKNESERLELIEKEINKVRETCRKLENLIHRVGGSDLLEKYNEDEFKKIRKMIEKDSLFNPFLSYYIFSPNNSLLRIFEEEGQIQPLGIHGEGLFKFLRFLDMQEDKTRFNEIKERLRLISWFKDFEIPKDLFGNERKIYITDKYLDRDLKYFDQRSSNEGFLFTLFYLALFVGEETPDFFAIDNIDNSLNPRLCRRLLQELIELAKKYDKQTILTTHNPAVLDGLDLDDDEQRLFVVYRNKFGYTKVRRVEQPKAIAGQKPVKLSEAFLRGYIGGLPKNF